MSGVASWLTLLPESAMLARRSRHHHEFTHRPHVIAIHAG